MAKSTVRVHGLDETLRALRKVEKSVAKDVQDGLKEAAGPVVTAARNEVSAFRGASVATIRARARGASVYVTQNARKVTGKRGDFGRKQQLILERELDNHEAAVTRGVEHALDRLIRSEGF